MSMSYVLCPMSMSYVYILCLCIYPMSYVYVLCICPMFILRVVPCPLTHVGRMCGEWSNV